MKGEIINNNIKQEVVMKRLRFPHCQHHYIRELGILNKISKEKDFRNLPHLIRAN
jgi:hypothetical protein